MKNKILINTVLLTASNFFIKVLSYLYFLIIARSFSPTEIGLYALLITTYMFMELTANLGLDKIVIRDMARQDEHRAGTTFFLALAVRVAAAVMSFVGFAVLYAVLYPDLWVEHRPEIFIVLAAVFPLVLSHNIESYFTALEKMHIPALSQLVERVILLAAAGLVTISWLDFKGFLLGFLAASLVRAAFLAAKYPWGRLRNLYDLTANRARRLVGEAMRMAVVEAMAIVYFRIDIFMLSKMTDLESTGVYQVAYKVFEFFIALFAGFIMAIFPKISREGTQFTLMRYLWLGSFGLALIAMPVIWARESVLAMFQLDFVKGSTVLVLLMATLPLVYWNSMLANFALAVNRLGLLIRIAMVLVALNIGLNFVLIPHMSINGAAAATLVCEAISSVLLMFGLRDAIRRGRLRAEVAEGQESA